MNLITPTELARRCTEAGNQITKQAAHKALDEGIIPFVLQGKRRMVDLDNKSVQRYITGKNRQREQAKKKDLTSIKTKSTSKKLSAKTPKIKSTSKKVSRKSANKNISSKHEQPDSIDLTDYEMKRRTNYATMRKKELETQHYEKNNLPTSFIDSCYISYIERLQTTIERIAGVSIQEIGLSILADGEVTPAHTEKFLNMILEAIHENKKAIIRELRKYEPK
jgi:hypothetical protein